MRQAFLFCVAWLFLAVSGIAADLEIVVPNTVVQPGQHYLLPVLGLTSEDLPTAQIVVEPSDSAQALGVTGWAGEQYLWFIAQEEGRHFVVVCVVRDNKAVLASASVHVGKPNPPPPPVPVPVPGDLAIVVVIESAERTPQQMRVLLALRKYCEKKSLWYRMADPDQKDAVTNQTPRWLAAARKKITESSTPLPALVIGSVADDVFSAVQGEEVPDTAEAAVAILEKYQQ